MESISNTSSTPPSHSLRTNYVAQIPHLNELIDVDLARRVGADLLQGATNLVIALAKAALLTGLDKLALLEVAVTVQIALSARRRGETPVENNYGFRTRFLFANTLTPALVSFPVSNVAERILTRTGRSGR